MKISEFTKDELQFLVDNYLEIKKELANRKLDIKEGDVRISRNPQRISIIKVKGFENDGIVFDEVYISETGIRTNSDSWTANEQIALKAYEKYKQEVFEELWNQVNTFNEESQKLQNTLYENVSKLINS